MKRIDFIKIIKLRSVWKIDKRRGNHTLPNGTKLSEYVTRLVQSQMDIDNLLIRENGDLCFGNGGGWNTELKEFNDYNLYPAFNDNEVCSYEDMERRIRTLVCEIIG